MDKPTKNDSDLVTYLLVSAVSVSAAKKKTYHLFATEDSQV